jgi:uncharacterized protein (DUF427 family)
MTTPIVDSMPSFVRADRQRSDRVWMFMRPFDQSSLIRQHVITP